MELKILGGVDAVDGGRSRDLGPPKQRAVLGILLLEAGRPVAADRLVEILWGDESPKAEASLRAYVSNLRRALEPGRRPRDEPTVLLTQPPGYRLAVDRRQVDFLRFEDLVAEGRKLLLDGDHAAAAGRFDEALALWRGDPLPELAGHPVAVDAAARLGSIRADALEGAAEARLALGDGAAAVAMLEPEATAHPLREHLHALLALGQYRCGRQADALRTIAAARSTLADVAGLDPGPELRKLEQDVLAQSPELDWVPARVAPPAGPLAPPAGPVAPPATSAEAPIVGRDAEVRVLTDALHAALAGRGTAAVVMGEPGIGKTRLVEELTAHARAAGATVATVCCPESGAVPPYWPAMMLGRQLREAGVFDADLPPAFSGDEPPPTATSQFALHELVVGALLGAGRPMLLVVDDVQWADPDSLRLLAHAAARLAGSPVLFAVASRPLDEHSPDALVDALGELVRTPGAVRVQLQGLDEEAVAAYLRQRAEVPDEVAHVVHGRTGGHPLFVKELAELLASEGRLADLAERALPAGVQLVVRRRVGHLPPATQQLLTVAAVVGRTFGVDVVAAVAGSPVEQVLDDLSPALDAGLVTDTDEPLRLQFSHALVADALAAEVNAARRARFHAAAARALAEMGADDVEVAHHALAGAVAGTAELAYDASVRAARNARAHLADEDAVVHWTNALAALERVRGADRIPAMLELAEAQFRADLVVEAKATVVSVIERGDVDAMARAVVLLDVPSLWPTQGYGYVDEPVVVAIERALAALPEARVAERSRACGALASTLAYSTDEPRKRAAEQAAVDLARRVGDPVVLAHALITRFKVLWRPTALDEREAVAEELAALAEQGVPDDLHVVILACQALVAYERARLDETEELLARAKVLVDRTGTAAHRSQIGWFLGALRVHRSRYDEARRLCDEAGEVYRRTRRIDAEIISYAAALAIALDTGGLDELFDALPSLNQVAGRYLPMFLETAAFALFEDGQVDAATAFLQGGLPPPTDDWTTMFADCLALQNRASIGDVDGCRTMLERARPWEDRWIAAGSGVLALGIGAHSLAIGAAAVGDLDEAGRLFEKAVTAHERLGCPAILARTLAQQGLLLGDGAARERARALATEHGLPYVLRRVQQAANPVTT